MSKFWPSNSRFHLCNPRMEITHRERGDVPGCVPAPREGIYRPVTSEQAIAECARRTDAYAKDVERYINGDLGKEHIFRSFDVPIEGAYGEKL